MSFFSAPARSGAASLAMVCGVDPVMDAIASFLTADDVCSLRKVDRLFRANDVLGQIAAIRRREHEWASNVGFVSYLIGFLRREGISISRLPAVDVECDFFRATKPGEDPYQGGCVNFYPSSASLSHSIMRGSMNGEPIPLLFLRLRPTVTNESLEECVLVLKVSNNRLYPTVDALDMIADQAISGEFSLQRLRSEFDYYPRVYKTFIENFRGHQLHWVSSKMGVSWQIEHEKIAQHTSQEMCVSCPFSYRKRHFLGEVNPQAFYRERRFLGGLNPEAFSDLLAGRDPLYALAARPFQENQLSLPAQNFRRRPEEVFQRLRRKLAQRIERRKEERNGERVRIVLCVVLVALFILCKVFERATPRRGMLHREEL